MKFKIMIECGETTCASEPGKFCRYVGTKSLGAKFVCRAFFDDSDNPTRLFDSNDGWLMRCKQCLKNSIIEDDALVL